MSKRPSPAASASGDPTVTILEAARAIVAERGLSQLSLRVVAERAGVSVGSISYRIGDRAALVDALAQREAALAQAQCDAWVQRIGAIVPGDLAWLADVVDAWLREGAGVQRTAAILQSELVSKAYRDPALAAPVVAITRAQTAMWHSLLTDWPDADRLALRIACYCIDERPFTILLDGRGDYTMLRASTLRSLIHWGHAPTPPGRSDWHMRLVGLLEEPARAAFDAGELPRGTKAAIAERIADMIIAGGLEVLSHRSIAQQLAMPVSSVAHHFPAQRDILLGGVETLYLRLRSEVRAAQQYQPAGSAVVALGHEMALAALRESAFEPFAIDMRRRRAENGHAGMSRLLTGGEDADRALTQAYVMAVIGFALGGLAGHDRRYDYADMVRQM